MTRSVLYLFGQAQSTMENSPVRNHSNYNSQVSKDIAKVFLLFITHYLHRWIINSQGYNLLKLCLNNFLKLLLLLSVNLGCFPLLN